jgi:hypothetical protein
LPACPWISDAGRSGGRLRVLSIKAGEEFNPSLTPAEANRRIYHLQRRPANRP